MLFISSHTYSSYKNGLFKNYTAIDGLSSSEVYDITQDNLGYIWFATDRGLTRFDGKNFKRYTISEGLPDNTILNFYEQPDGTIWCSTMNHKIFYFKNEKDGFNLYKYNEILSKNISNNRVINNLVITEEKELLLTFNNLDLFLEIDRKGNVLNRPVRQVSENKLVNIKILQDKAGVVFVDRHDVFNTKGALTIEDLLTGIAGPSFNGIVNYNKTNNIRCVYIRNWYFIIYPNNDVEKREVPFYKEKVAIKAGKIEDDLLWIGYQYGGAIIMDLNGDIKQHFLKDKSVTKVFKDHEGGVWVSTLNSGVFYCKEPLIDYHSCSSFPTELAKDNDDNLVVAFHNGEVKTKENEEGDFEILYNSNNMFPVFIGHDKSVNQLYIEELNSPKINNSRMKINNDQVYGISDDEIFTDSFGKSYVKIYKNDTKKEIKVPERIYDISKKENYILIGTQNGLYQYNNSKLKSLKGESDLFRHRISDIDIKNDKAYIATMGRGIVIKQEDTILNINKKEGLLSDICTEIYVEDPYTFWVGTNRGINRITLYKNNTFDIDSISSKEGLVCSEILDIEIIDKQVWIASREGLFSFPKNIFDRIRKKYRKWLHIDKIVTNQKHYSVKDIIEIEPFKKNSKIHFKAISFKSEGNNEYRYKLKSNEPWYYTKSESIDLSHLAFGKYQLILQVKSTNGKWLESIEKSIIVYPPFWKTSWFFLLIASCVGVLIYIFFKFQVLVFRNYQLKIIYKALLNRLRSKEQHLYVNIKSNGKIVKLFSNKIGYFKSSRNYIEIFTQDKKYLVRKKLDDFYKDLPDSIEFTKVHRSYYVRMDKISEIKGNKEVYIFNNAIPVSKTYADNLKRISA
ncbi:hypothetical protein BTO06_05635 [Tenacibaculum sp. SZ-18]|nr:hypothetical protein BTO06_05635 [Tenacibaculum sp. SZ-18]